MCNTSRSLALHEFENLSLASSKLGSYVSVATDIRSWKAASLAS